MSFKKTASTLAIGTILGFGVFYGIEKHNDMKVEANFQETLENMDESKVDLHIVAETLKSKMNEQATYTVSSSTATIKCFNEYTEGVKYARNILTGEILKNPFNKKEEWVTCKPTIWTYAKADSSFKHDVDFSDASVSVLDNKIIAEVSYPYLNKDSISVNMKTFRELEAEKIDDKTTYKNGMNADAQILDMEHNMKRNNNSSIKTNARTAWQVKYLEVAPEEINNIYKTDELRKAELEENTVKSVKTLLDSLLVDTLKSLGVVDENVELEVKIRK